jgi:hypothetical protein
MSKIPPPEKKKKKSPNKNTEKENAFTFCLAESAAHAIHNQPSMHEARSSVPPQKQQTPALGWSYRSSGGATDQYTRGREFKRQYRQKKKVKRQSTLEASLKTVVEQSESLAA